MTIDHMGSFLWPDELWLKAIGRITFPVWFFLVGYSRSSKLHWDIIILALLMIPLNPLTHQPFFPLNALVSIIICRLAINWLFAEERMEKYFGEIMAASLVFLLPTFILFEYGTMAILFAIMGRIVRLEQQSRKNHLFYFYCYALFTIVQLFNYTFDVYQAAFVVIGTAIVVYYLHRFSITPFLVGKDNIGKFFIRLISRNSLYYYVAHRVAFQIIGLYWYPGLFSEFRWT
jgi:hypothetical protein